MTSVETGGQTQVNGQQPLTGPQPANGQQHAGAEAGPAPAAESAHGSSAGAEAQVAHAVADIVARAKDSGGERIELVYFKREKTYAIYRRGTPPQVVICYADAPDKADEQITAISGLLPLRDHLVRLIDDLPSRAQEHFRTQIADALRLGLEKQIEPAKALLAEAIDAALAAQSRQGRLVYLQWTALALLPALLLIVGGGLYVQAHNGVHLLLMAAGSGALGAVLSIAIGIRARTVAIEGDWSSNAVDAAVRVGIGMISAGVLFLLLNSGIVAKINAGDVALTGTNMNWQVALVIGFAAGFLERLVPDLLEKTAPPKAAPQTAAGAAGVAPGH
jgi:hypothetical protein